jgi:8-oxo-dGTP diphosphatase
VLIQDGCLLMVRQPHRGEELWTFPGGRIEPGEPPDRAAVREAREEVGLDVEIVRLLVEVPRRGGGGTYRCYLGRVVAGTVVLGADPEVADGPPELLEARWRPIAEVRASSEVARVLAALPT